MMYLFIDTETNGKILNYRQPMTNVNNFPRITQLAYILYDYNGSEIGFMSDIIKPDGWTVPKEKFFIDHGITTENCEQYGVPIHQALLSLIDGIRNADYIIAHNIEFDYPVIGAEMIRANLKAGKVLPKICTMKSTIEYCKLEFNPKRTYKSEYKYPKLEELHMNLFGEDSINKHDALGDVKTTAKCFFKLLELGVIKLPIK